MSIQTLRSVSENSPSPRDPAPARSAASTSAPEKARVPAAERERELIRHILEGSRSHFEELYRDYSPRVYRFALKRLRDTAEAEDVTQEVFETVFYNLASFRGESALLVWIFGITRNKVNRRFRGKRPPIESLDDGAADVVAANLPGTERAIDARRILDRCGEMITEDLTPLQRRIFHLKHLRRQPIRAIAETLGKSEDAIKANLYRMRRALADGAPGLEGFLNS